MFTDGVYRHVERMIDDRFSDVRRVIEGGKIGGDKISGGGGSTPIPGGALPSPGDPDTPYAAAEHATQHQQGGDDELAVDSLPTSETDSSLVLRPDGEGGVEWDAESAGGVSEITDLPTSESDQSLFLRPDGSGSVEWATPPGGGGGGTPDPHASTHEQGGSDELALDASQIVSGEFADGRISESSVTQHAPSQSDFSDHSARHEQGGDDTIEIADMGTAETDDTRFLKADGNGGVEWAEPPTGEDVIVYDESPPSSPTVGLVYIDATGQGITPDGSR
jgi:hypothetical protein